MNEKDLLLLSIKDFLTPKMLKYSIVPLIVTAVLMYAVFFILAGIGLDQLGSVDIQTTQTTVQNGIEHTDSFSAKLEGSSIMQFLMSYAVTSWIASFLVYAIGSFFVLYFSVFVAVIVIGFLTPFVIKELQSRRYADIELIGHSNTLLSVLQMIKWIFVMLLLFVLFIPLYFIPIVNVIAFNFPLYYFFHKMLIHDVSSNICTKEEDQKIRFFHKNNLRGKTLLLYLVSFVPFAVFFGAVFYVIYISNTYFSEVKKYRSDEKSS